MVMVKCKKNLKRKEKKKNQNKIAIVVSVVASDQNNPEKTKT